MAKTSKIHPHLSLSEINSRLGQTQGFWKVKRWMAIGYTMAIPSSAKQIGKAVGLGESTLRFVRVCLWY